MRMLPPTGFCRLSTLKSALRYAELRVLQDCKVTLLVDDEGMYRVEFEPAKKGGEQ